MADPPPPAALYDHLIVTTQPGQAQQVHVSGDVTVRTMTRDDAAFAGRCLVEGFRDKFEHAVGPRHMDQMFIAAEDEHRLIAHRYHKIFIAEYQGRPAGAMELKYHGDRDGDSSDKWTNVPCCALCRLMCMGCCIERTGTVPAGWCYLDHIAVDPGFRGKGIGKALMDAADIQAKQRGCRRIFLYVASDNRAKNLYAREGYVKTETTTMCGCARCCTGKEAFEKMEKPLISETSGKTVCI